MLHTCAKETSLYLDENGDIVIEQFRLDKENKNKFKAWNVNTDSNFAVLLIGTDDGEKFRWYQLVSAKDIFDMADVIPMRKQEIKGNRK